MVAREIGGPGQQSHCLGEHHHLYIRTRNSRYRDHARYLRIAKHRTRTENTSVTVCCKSYDPSDS